MLANRFLPWKMCILALIISLLSANAVQAYVPGPEVIGSVGSLLAWLALIFSSILLWPIHALVRRWRRSTVEEGVEPTAPSTDPPAEGVREQS